MSKIIYQIQFFWIESFRYMNYHNETLSGKLRYWKRFLPALIRFLRLSWNDPPITPFIKNYHADNRR